jgi:SH3 domain-containing protein/PEGA domain-containing protein
MKLSYIFLLFLIPLLLTACSLPFGGKKNAALSVTASPKSGVFLNDKHVGSTPYYDEKLKPGEYFIKIMPESGIGLPWEAQIKLSGGIMTVISRELGETPDQSSGYALTLEPELSKDKTSLQVVTVPDGSVVSVDGEPRGFSPVAVDVITPGDHVLLVSSPGYIERSINAQITDGHKLTVSVSLRKSSIPVETKDEKKEEESEEEIDEEEVLDAEEDETQKKVGAELESPYVIIQDTSTGWLNVREKASTASDNIITKVNPGEKYKYLDSNKIGWYQIELEDGQEGWISSKYAKLVED